jgi:hypothetical protein
MTLERAVYLLRLHLNDVQKIGWPEDDELIEYMDRATSLLTDKLISMRHNKLLKYIDIDGPTELPQDFVTFVGKVPIQIVGNTAIAYGKVDQKMPVERWHNPNIPRDANRPMWGGQPIDEEYKTWDELTKTTKTKVLYWTRLPFPSTFTGEQELPYEQEVNTLILDIGRMFALNKNEYDLTQDFSIQQQIMASMQQARGIVNESDGGQ